jgi:hypothetical protein
MSDLSRRASTHRESADAGTAYQSGLAALDWYRGGEYVIINEAGIPVHPRVVLRRVRAAAQAGRACEPQGCRC